MGAVWANAMASEGKKKHLQVRKVAFNAHFFQVCLSAQASWEGNQSLRKYLSPIVCAK